MASKPEKWQRSRVVFQPGVHRGMLRGIEQMTDAVRPTLGPLPRIVLYDTTIGAVGKIPELLDDGGTIARRIIQIRGRNADVEAKLGTSVDAKDYAWQIWSKRTRYIGVGAMLIGGLWTIFKMRGSLLSGMKSGLKAPKNL